MMRSRAFHRADVVVGYETLLSCAIYRRNGHMSSNKYESLRVSASVSMSLCCVRGRERERKWVCCLDLYVCVLRRGGASEM